MRCIVGYLFTRWNMLTDAFDFLAVKYPRRAKRTKTETPQEPRPLKRSLPRSLHSAASLLLRDCTRNIMGGIESDLQMHLELHLQSVRIDATWRRKRTQKRNDGRMRDSNRPRLGVGMSALNEANAMTWQASESQEQGWKQGPKGEFVLLIVQVLGPGRSPTPAA